MKVLFKTGVLLGTLGMLVLSGCQKEEQIAVQPKPQADVAVSEGMLVFKTRDVFDVYNSQLDEVAKGTTLSNHLAQKETKLNFLSMRAASQKSISLPGGRTMADQGIEDEYLASMLSPEGLVQIGEWIFKLDMPNKKCYALAQKDEILLGEMKKAAPFSDKIQAFSTDDEVLDLLENGQKSGRVTGLFCREDGQGEKDDKDFESFGFGGTYRLDCKVVYQKAAIYFSLQAKVKIQYKDGLGIWYAYPEFPYVTGFYQWKPKCRDEIGRESFGDYAVEETNEISRRAYEASRGLNKFWYRVQFGLTSTTTKSRVYEIKAGY